MGVKFIIHTTKQKTLCNRTCLRCEEDFESSWIGNRMCPQCVQDTTHMESYTVHYKENLVFQEYHSL